MLTQFRRAVRRLWAACLCAVVSALLPGVASASEYDPDDLINVSYIHAAVLGTGTYSLRERRVTMLKLPIAWKQRAATPESVGWRWLAPVVLGYDDLSSVDSDIIESLLPDQLLTLTVMPGVEFIYPVNQYWYLKPFVELGGGRDFNQEETFFLTQLGVRSLSTFEMGESWRLLLGGAVRWAGEYQYHSDDTNAFGIIDLGLDVRRNLPWKLFEQRLDLGTYYIYQRYLPEWRAGEADDWQNRALEVHEFGLSLGIPHGRKVFGININRVRLGYKKGGKFKGWTLGTEFPF